MLSNNNNNSNHFEPADGSTTVKMMYNCVLDLNRNITDMRSKIIYKNKNNKK